MRLHGVHGQVEFRCHLFLRQVRRKKSEDFPFPGSQGLRPPGIGGRPQNQQALSESLLGSVGTCPFHQEINDLVGRDCQGPEHVQVVGLTQGFFQNFAGK
ncbi:hypothetical protein D3C73_1476670 [compost metagenome]